MRVLVLQHVPFEGPARLRDWCVSRGHELSLFPVYQGAKLPPLQAFDQLIVLGGPMSVHDEAEFPWLSAEKGFIEETIAAGKPLVGVCLGAQLIAQVLGAPVQSNGRREIGWFDISLDPAGLSGITEIPPRLSVMHWHGETFGIPSGMRPFASSTACAHQGFVSPDWRILALQCHLEWDPATAQALIDHCGDELDGSEFVQSADEIIAGFATHDPAPLLFRLLDRCAPAQH